MRAGLRRSAVAPRISRGALSDGQRCSCGVACESRCILALQRSDTAGVCAGIVGVDVVGDHVCALADVAEEDVGCRVARLAV